MGEKLKMIPLCQLQRSKKNVRKTEPLIDIESLAASIEANGLLENLVVTPSRNGGRDAKAYDVVAGGRRLAALKLLAKRGKVDGKYPVPCLVRDQGDAVEVSLAENFARSHLHPADQFEAFAELLANGSSPDDIGARFGVTATFVEQRLKLAQVSPRLIAEYRKGAMTLEQLTAFTVCGDHPAQDEAWFGHPYAEISAALIRRLLTKAHVYGNDRRARFIGAQAYRDAGGTIVRDLFDAENEGYFGDSQLLDRLVSEKLQAAAAEIGTEGWQWVEIHPEADFGLLGRFGRARTASRKLGKAEERRLARLSKRYDALVAELEESDSASSEELDQVAGELAALQAKKEVWPEKERARSGAIVSLSADGTLQVFRGLVRPQMDPQDAGKGSDTARPKQEGYSDPVLLDLSAHRSAALREELAAKPDEALLALLGVLGSQLLYRGEPGSCVRVVASETRLDHASASVGASKAAEAFVKRHDGWLKQLPDIAQFPDWLRRLAKPDRLRLLAHCIAMTVNVLHSSSARCGAQEDGDRLTVALGLDMSAWWRPTAGNFLSRLTKTEILAAVSEGVSADAARRIERLKKGAMVAEAETLLTTTNWLPPSLRHPEVQLDQAAE